MQIPRYWRLQKERYQLLGFRRVNASRQEEVSRDGHHWLLHNAYETAKEGDRKEKNVPVLTPIREQV